MAARKDKNPFKKKDKYRIRNWSEYNRSLINRGSITFWFSQDVIDGWYSTKKLQVKGRPKKYSDAAILCGLMMKALFHIPFRMLQGLINSLIEMLELHFSCPNYSVFCRRARELKIPVRKWLKPGEHLNVIFDSTGMKVLGEGEWKVRKHGYSKRRTWRKVHVGLCADTGQVVVSAVTSNEISDDLAMIYMMEALDDVEIGDVFGDGAYDTIDCREAIYNLGGRQIIPPDKNAKIQKGKPIPALQERDKIIRRIQEFGEDGRALWKKESGYHRRSRVETHMFRHKTILGDKLAGRRDWSQVTEIRVGLEVLNRMTELGRPKSYKIAI